MLPDAERWAEKWRQGLTHSGLRNVLQVILEVVEPLSPLGAQVLWVMQPTLSVFIERERISRWANFLEDPQQVAQLCEYLTETEEH